MTAETRLPFDLARLQMFLRDRGLTEGPVRLQRIGDGHSNLTYMVSDGSQRLVLRRPPPPPLPPGGHDVLREARLLRALEHTDVPVPTVFAIDDQNEIMDVPFYVMEYFDGSVMTSETAPGLDNPEGRLGVAEALVDTLAALHAVDWRGRGLEDFGRPDGFLERQLRRMSALIADDNGELPERFCDLAGWLRDTMPQSETTTIVHGDFRLGNVMFAHETPARVVAVLDWELATIGDPLVDVGYFLATYAVPGESGHAITELGRATRAPGYPSREELAARYAAASGRSLGDLRWYTTLVLWRLAVLFEYSRNRYLAGRGDPYYDDPELVAGFLAAARTAADLQAMPPIATQPTQS